MEYRRLKKINIILKRKEKEMKQGKVLKVFTVVGVFFAFSFFAFASAWAQDGKAVYDKNKCAICHGKNGEGKMGPKLAKTKLDEKALKKVIVDGKKAKKGASMPSYKGKINDKDMDALVKFLKSL